MHFPSFRPSKPWLAAIATLLAAQTLPTHAEVPFGGRAEDRDHWRQFFQTRVDARLSPSFSPDAELETRISRVWSALVGRLAPKGGSALDPLQQYPVLGFVDEQFFVMKYRTPAGKDSFVVRAEADGLDQVPTLTSTLRGFLQGIYAALEEVADEAVTRMAAGDGYDPDFSELEAQNPFQHGNAIRVPDMGSFKNRLVRFTGLRGRLESAEMEGYERQKREAEAGQSLQLARAHRWGVAVEIAELVQEGLPTCFYRMVREVSAVNDRFVGEGRNGALLREPRLGPVLEVSGCVEACENPASWRRLFPDREEKAEPEARRRQARRPAPPHLAPGSGFGDDGTEPPGSAPW
jgi:hypothetical protein